MSYHCFLLVYELLTNAQGCIQLKNVRYTSWTTNYKRYNNLKPFFKKNSGSKSYESVGKRNENSYIKKIFRQE